jgi:exonuclease VII small subunit
MMGMMERLDEVVEKVEKDQKELDLSLLSFPM